MNDNYLPNRIKDVCQYIQNHYTDTLLLRVIADRTCLCPEAFCRYFKKHMGITFVSYLTQVRIDVACLLLANNVDEKSISTIAYECGFTSISSFNRMFKRHLGMPPTEYVACL